MLDKQSPELKNRVGILAVYFVLLVVGIPWYWPKDSSLIIMGLPAWVFIAILVSLLTSIFTAFLLLRYPWQMEIDSDE